MTSFLKQDSSLPADATGSTVIKMARKKLKAKPKARKKRKQRKSSKQKHQGSLFGWLFKWLFVIGLWGGIGLTCLVAWYASELPDITKTATFERKTSITIKADNGTLIARYGELHGNSVAVEDLPPHLVYAVLSIEDRRFYQHFGIDIIGFSRAMAVNISKRRFVQGGSTITQQLAKNLFLSRDRKIKRKIQEALLALWLERELTKDEILSAYLNRVYLGSGAYGVEAASKRYFNKDVKKINVREAALLAGLLKAPSRYSPLKNPDLSKQRTNVVMAAMVKTGYITEATAKSYNTQLLSTPAKPTGINNTRYFTDWVVEGLDDLIGTPPDDLIIQTTLNPKLQKTAQSALAAALKDEDKNISQGAIVAMRPNGSVVAMIGGLDYTTSQFNRITQAKRPPGSAFKPILFLTALEKGWEPDDLILDAPIEEGEYRPKNFGSKYYGEVSLETALAKSMNTAAIRLMKDTGRRPVIETAKRLGIYSELQPDLSLALGSSGLSPLELTTSYAVIANGGHAVFPYAITKITDKNGAVYYQRAERVSTRRVVQKRHARDLTSMMNTVIQEGTGRGAQPGFKAAGKTGTSQNSRDAWFSGFTDELVTTVWLGNDDNTPMNNITGGSAPAIIWRDVMKTGHKQYNPISARDFNSSGFNNLLSKILSGDRAHHGNNRRYNE